MLLINNNFSKQSFKGLLVHKNQYGTTAINTDHIKKIDDYTVPRNNENRTYKLDMGYAESV